MEVFHNSRLFIPSSYKFHYVSVILSIFIYLPEFLYSIYHWMEASKVNELKYRTAFDKHDKTTSSPSLNTTVMMKRVWTAKAACPSTTVRLCD